MQRFSEDSRYFSKTNFFSYYNALSFKFYRSETVDPLCRVLFKADPTQLTVTGRRTIFSNNIPKQAPLSTTLRQRIIDRISSVEWHASSLALSFHHWLSLTYSFICYVWFSPVLVVLPILRALQNDRLPHFACSSSERRQFNHKHLRNKVHLNLLYQVYKWILF